MRNFSFHHLSSRVICSRSIQIISKQRLHLDSPSFLSWKHQSQNIAGIPHSHPHMISYSLQIASIESLSYSQNVFPHHWDTDSWLLNYSLRHLEASHSNRTPTCQNLKTATSFDFACWTSFVPCQHIICQKTDVPWRSMVAENLDPSCGFRLNWRGRVWLRCNCTTDGATWHQLFPHCGGMSPIFQSLSPPAIQICHRLCRAHASEGGRKAKTFTR